jgi:kumamolisin
MYPASSPRVVPVGGTTINRTKTAEFTNESVWECTGAGSRSDIQIPTYQKNVQSVPPLGGRGLADVSAVSDPRRGVWVFVGDLPNASNGWLIVGGTSVATPVVAGLINQATKFNKTGLEELKSIYKNPDKFTDITSGQCGRLVKRRVDCCDAANKDKPCCDPANPRHN